MPRVFILEPVGMRLDTSSCELYGEPYYLYPRGCKHSATHTALERDILDRLLALNYVPGADYIVIAGKTSKVAMLVGAVTNYYTPTRLLIYCDTRRKYVVQDLREHGLTNELASDILEG